MMLREWIAYLYSFDQETIFLMEDDSAGGLELTITPSCFRLVANGALKIVLAYIAI